MSEATQAFDEMETLQLVRQRLEAVQQDPTLVGKEFAVLLSTGSLSPVHRQHLRIFDIAARALRTQHNIEPVAAFLSPSCDHYVQCKLRKEAIPFVHRLAMCKLACTEHNNSSNCEIPVAVDSWEGSQPCFVDFPEVHGRMAHQLQQQFPKLLCLYVCGVDHFERCGLDHYHDVVAVARPPFSTTASCVPAKHIFVVTGAVDAADMSSTEIRKRRAAHQSIADLTFDSVAAYLHDTLHWI